MERAAQANPLQTIRDALDGMSGARRGVAEVILTDPAFAGSASITALAERAGTLPATISRLATMLGYSGYPALRAAIAEENGRGSQAGWESDIGTEISPGDGPDVVLSVLTGRQFGAMRSAMASIDLPLIESLADQIVQAARVIIFAQWGDLPPARELQMRLLRIGIPVWFHEASYEAEVSSGLLAPGDVALVLSRSGESAEAERVFARARARGALTAVITGEPDAPLGVSADVTVFTGTGVGHSWTDYFAGRISDSLATGLLFVLVAQRVPEAVRSEREPALYNAAQLTSPTD
ncbi:MAG: MurR/RpiR family transcriptional regulator [Microbacterium sp.]